MKTTTKRTKSIYKTLLIIILSISTFFTFGFKSIENNNLVSSNNYTPGLKRSFYSQHLDGREDFRVTLEYMESERDSQNKLTNFISELENGNSWQIAGIYVEDKMEINVVFQPSTNPGFVSGLEDTATKFEMASDYGTLGMLAHNYLAGENFFELETGDMVYVIYGDGSHYQYEVNKIKQYQALSPHSSYSEFRDLENDSYLTAINLFYTIYQGDGELVLQTCIDNEGVESWGRYFVIAEPVS